MCVEKHFCKEFSVGAWGLFAFPVSNFDWRVPQYIYVMNLGNNGLNLSLRKKVQTPVKFEH